MKLSFLIVKNSNSSHTHSLCFLIIYQLFFISQYYHSFPDINNNKININCNRLSGIFKWLKLHYLSCKIMNSSYHINHNFYLYMLYINHNFYLYILYINHIIYICHILIKSFNNLKLFFTIRRKVTLIIQFYVTMNTSIWTERNIL